MDWYLKAWRQYADISGRATRSEFWCFALVHLIVITGLSVLAVLSLDSSAGNASAVASASLVESSAITTLIAYLIASAPPTVAVTIRRLHDSGRAGWWLLVLLVPVLGLLVLAALLAFDSQRWTENPWGPQPNGW